MRTSRRACSLRLALPMVLAAALVASAPAAAQSVSAGVVGGLNASTITDLPNADATTLRREPGVAAGLFIEFPASRFVSLQPEAIYVQKGVRVEGSAAPGLPPATITERFDYIEVPILVRVGAIGDRSGVYGLVGPALARLVRAHERFDVPGVGVLEQDVKDGVTATDVSFLLGIGFSTGRVGIEGRIDLGVRNLIPPADRRSGDPRPTNRSAAVVARLRL